MQGEDCEIKAGHACDVCEYHGVMQALGQTLCENWGVWMAVVEGESNRLGCAGESQWWICVMGLVWVGGLGGDGRDAVPRGLWTLLVGRGWMLWQVCFFLVFFGVGRRLGSVERGGGAGAATDVPALTFVGRWTGEVRCTDNCVRLFQGGVKGVYAWGLRSFFGITFLFLGGGVSYGLQM